MNLFLKQTNQENGVIKERLELAVDWLLSSGIQNRQGYFNAWYDLEKKKYSFIYDEMIGYGTQTLLSLYDRWGKTIYLQKAKKAIDWLIENMLYKDDDPKANNTFIWKYDLPDGPFSTKVYTFDTGMCLSSIVDLYIFTEEKKYLDIAVSAANWMVDVMRNHDGSFKASYDFQEKSFGTGRWSLMPGAYHSKLSIGLLKLFNVTEDERLKKSVIDLCDWVMQLQLKDGRFKININSEDTYVHPHCYAAEGLFYAGKELPVKRYEDAAIKATNWLMKIQKDNGSVSRWYYSKTGLDSNNNAETLAQTIRLYMLSNPNQTCKEELFIFNKLKKAIDHLSTMQCFNENKHAMGGFYYASIDAKRVPHINCCATLFSIQALQMYLDWKTGNFQRDYYLRWLI